MDVLVVSSLLIWAGSKWCSYHVPSRYFAQINHLSTISMCDIYSKVRIKTPERRQWLRFSVSIVNFEQISHIVTIIPLFTLNK